jgi:hypothetical protein
VVYITDKLEGTSAEQMLGNAPKKKVAISVESKEESGYR